MDEPPAHRFDAVRVTESLRRRCVAVALLVVSLAFGAAAAATAGGSMPTPTPLEDPLARPRFESVGVNSIPRDVVASLAQDKAGFIWIGTGDGLVRYDGHRFRPVERESSDPTRRNLGWVPVMLSGSDGRLWIGTENLGLAMHDPVDGRVSLFRGGGVHDAPAHSILALAEDKQGGIWVGGLGGGLARFDPAKRRFTVHRRPDMPRGLPDDRISALLVDRSGDLWIGSWKGLARHRPGSDGFEPVPIDGERGSAGAAPNIVALHQAADGRIWAGAADGRLVLIDPDSLAVRQLDRGSAQGLASVSPVNSFVQAPDRTMWAGSSTGIELYDAANGQLLQRLRHDIRDRAGLAADEVSSMLLDRAGMIWVGGFGLGLQRHDTDHGGIRVRGADLRPGAVLSTVDLRSLLQLEDGSILAASREAGIVRLDRRLRTRGVVLGSAEMAALTGGPAAPVETMLQRADGSIWLGTKAALVRLDATRPPRLLKHDGDRTSWLLESRSGALWVATQDGLHVLRPGSSQLERILLRGGAPLTGPVFRLAEGKDGRLWVGTARGLFTLDAAPEAQLHEVVAQRAVDGLASPVVVGLLVDRDGSLWVDTAIAGLHRMTSFDGSLATFDRISERHGIVNRPFGSSLLQDERGRIWTHMHVYDPAQDRLHELTAADGVDIGTGWFGSQLKTDGGRLLFGGSRGLLVVEPERFDASDYEPPLVVSELRIDGAPQLSRHPTGTLRIGPSQRSFSVEFAALDYADPQRSRYAHQLDGFDPGWIETGSDFRIASYSNLEPGNYLLRVRATNRSGVWSSRELAIAVEVEPAWWQRTSTQLLAAVLLALLLLGLERWRTSHLRRSKLVLENKVQQRTAELERVAAALQQESAALDEASMTDSLSGLRNRRFLMRYIEAESRLVVRRHADHEKRGGLASDDSDLIFFLIDIDHFKQINDQHGHAAGDAVIAQMRERLQQVFRDSDYLVRWGGEEFLIVARGTSRMHAAFLAERVLHAVANEPFALADGHLLHKTCSVGFSCFPLSPTHPDALDWWGSVNTADAALYAVKRTGRNGWLGLVSAHAASVDELAAWSQRPLAEWAASGQLEMAVSPRHAGWMEERPKS